jgi:hypothetical protein
VRAYASVTKHIRHGIEVVEAPHEPNQRLTIYTVEPDSPTARMLPILSSWALDTPNTASAAGGITS